MLYFKAHLHHLARENKEKYPNQENWIPGSESGKKNEYDVKSGRTVRQVQWEVRARMLPLSFLACTDGASKVHPLGRRQMSQYQMCLKLPNANGFRNT
jgi:hypothetical protein